MAKEMGRFDSALQMFVEPVKEPSMPHLKFLRWRAERGEFGNKPMSAPMGEHVFKLSDAEIAHYAVANKRALVIGKH